MKRGLPEFILMLAILVMLLAIHQDTRAILKATRFLAVKDEAERTCREALERMVAAEPRGYVHGRGTDLGNVSIEDAPRWTSAKAPACPHCGEKLSYYDSALTIPAPHYCKYGGKITALEQVEKGVKR